MLAWVWNILVWLDQGVNVMVGPLLNLVLRPRAKFGDPDETLSSVLGKNREDCKTCYWVRRVLHVFDKNHCERSIEEDEGH